MQENSLTYVVNVLPQDLMQNDDDDEGVGWWLNMKNLGHHLQYELLYANTFVRVEY